MKKLLTSRGFYIALAIIVIAIVIAMIQGVKSRDNGEMITITADEGTVRQLVSVSGIAEAKQTAELAFSVVGTVQEVMIETGSVVEKGDVLVTLDARALYADRQEALAAVSQAVASRDELIAGPTNTSRDLTAETITAKLEALETTKANEARKIENAYHILLSTDLTAYSENADEPALPPTITGTYTCNTEGGYYLDVFNSKSESGYSYRLSGLETGNYTAATNQASPLGNCGLQIQFNTNSNYSNSDWVIDIPNTKSAQYVTNRNAYALTVTQAESAIALAEQAVRLAEADATNQNAPARSEAITRANATVTQAQARLSRIDASIADRILKAPFAGVITNIDVLPGETVTSAPIVTLLADSAFEVKARIPEIDIGKLLVGQAVEMVFDARPQETLYGNISFISPKATEIDGVAYYEAYVQFSDLPDWMRSGLNTDIEIIIS